MPVVDITIDRRGPYAGGQSFGDAGPYEALRGSVTFAVDPDNKANERIVDLGLAPRDSDGRVRFRSDFALMVPADQSKSSGKFILDLPNRGNPLTPRINRAPQGGGPSDDPHPGDGFLYRKGWTVGSIGWQWDVIRNGRNLGITPPPTLVNGLPVRGQVTVEFRPLAPQRTRVLADRVHQAYPAASIDDPDAIMTVRDWEDGPDTVIPREQWRFAREAAEGEVIANREHVFLESGFEPGRIYYLTYNVEGAPVAGTGLLAFREFATFLKHPSYLNPMAAGHQQGYGFGISQTGRAIRTFIYNGLNLDEEGRQVFDGLLPHVAGGRYGEFNNRFAQPSFQALPGFGQSFPFNDDDLPDPYSEAIDGVFSRQRRLGGMPKVVYTNSSAEYWRGDGSLAHTDPTGEADVDGAPESRNYHMSGTQHGAGSLRSTGGGEEGGANTTRYTLLNVVDYTPLLRAALINLDRWVSEGVEPPASKHPRLDEHTLVKHEEIFPTINAIPGLATPDPKTLWRLRKVNLGPDASRGIGQYPVTEGETYPAYVAALDADGNELGGVRLPDLTVPVGTHAGWTLRNPDTGAPEQQVAMLGFTKWFPATKAQREATNDPRPSIEERYPSREVYVERVRQEAEALAAQRYILPEDIEIVVENCAARYDAALAAGA